MFECLMGFNIALTSEGHLARVSACSSCIFDQCGATQECHAADTGHDTPPCYIT